MRAAGFKAAVVLLIALIMTGQALAGWGGGGRRGGGRFGPGFERGLQGDSEEQGPWMRRGPGRGAPEREGWQGGPGRGWGEPQAFGPRGGGRRMSRGFGGPGGPGVRQGFQGRGFGPGGPGRGPGAEMMRRRFIQGNRGQGFRGGRVGGSFRRGAGMPGRGGWNGPGRGLQGRNIGPRRRDFGRKLMMQRGPWSGRQGQDPRPGGVGRGFRGRNFQGPARGFQGRGYRPWGQSPREYGRGQSFGPGGRGRGFNRGEVRRPEGQEREERPTPGPRGGRGRGGRPEEKGNDIETPIEADKPKEDQPVGEDV